MSRTEGRFLSELRRSNASGVHRNRSSDRYNNNRHIIDWEIKMTGLDDNEYEPTLADLTEIDNDYDLWADVYGMNTVNDDDRECPFDDSYDEYEEE